MKQKIEIKIEIEMCGRDNFMDREMHSQWPVFGFSKSTLPYWQRFYILIRLGKCSARAFSLAFANLWQACLTERSSTSSCSASAFSCSATENVLLPQSIFQTSVRRFGIRYRGLVGNCLIYYRVGGSGEGPLNFFALLKPPVRTDF